MDDGITVRGPITDVEMGTQTYVVERGPMEVTFGVRPVETEDGAGGWVMLLGGERVESGDHSIEPYDTAEEAYEAGMRASREILLGRA